MLIGEAAHRARSRGFEVLGAVAVRGQPGRLLWAQLLTDAGVDEGAARELLHQRDPVASSVAVRALTAGERRLIVIDDVDVGGAGALEVLGLVAARIVVGSTAVVATATTPLGVGRDSKLAGLHESELAGVIGDRPTGQRNAIWVASGGLPGTARKLASQLDGLSPGRDPLVHLALHAVQRGEFLHMDDGLIRLLEAALARTSDDGIRAMLLARMSCELLGDPLALSRRRSLADEALRLARRADDDAVLAEVLDARLYALWDPAGAEDRMETATMAADLYGTADGRPPLLLLPGLTFDRGVWEPVLANLARKDPGRHILSLDLPGHGESSDQLPHSMDHVLSLIHEAVTEAGLDAPVVVGHSMSGGYGSMYAAKFPARGVVNVDALPDLVPFVRLLQSAKGQILGDGFAGVWAMMEQGFRLDLLSSSAQDVVARTSRPRQDLVVSYWDELLSHTPDELAAQVSSGIEAVAKAGVPYLLVLGSEPPPEVAERLHGMLPQIEIEVWPDTGHFPHLAYPDRFAERLAATAGWQRADSPVRVPRWPTRTAIDHGLVPVYLRCNQILNAYQTRATGPEAS